MDNKAFEDHPIFDTKDKEGLYFVRLLECGYIFAWENENKFGVWSAKALRVDPAHVEIEALKELGVWKKLDKEAQYKVEHHIDSEKEAIRERMAKARESRKSKYDGVPREVVCRKCGHKQAMAPGTIVKRAEKGCRSIENWVKEWECIKCNPPKRGRRKGSKNKKKKS